MWKIHGKTYDLTHFAKNHPGGPEIIEKTKGIDDCTALFETYHAFYDLENIKQGLAKYEVVDDKNITEYTTDFTKYYQLVERVKTVFPDRASIKAPPSWYMWNGFALCAFLYTMYYSVMSKYYIVKCFFAVLFACIEVSLVFNVLHDGSHYAISINPQQNNMLSTIVNSWILWNHSLWLYQHVYYHHIFTGGSSDTDKIMYNMGSIIRIPVYFEWIYNFMYCFFPGQSTMQALWHIYSYFNKQLSFTTNDKLPIPSETIYYDNLSLSVMGCKLIFLLSIGFVPTMFVLTIENTLYYMNVFPNHNLYETHENHYDGDDWAKRQICNSGNFVNQHKWWTVMFSGINHQIEHHLFPNMSGHHYSVIAPIVREFCREQNIPYVHHPTLLGAYKSFMKKNALKKRDHELAKPLETELPRKESSESEHSDEWVRPEKEE